MKLFKKTESHLMIILAVVFIFTSCQNDDNFVQAPITLQQMLMPIKLPKV